MTHKTRHQTDPRAPRKFPIETRKRNLMTGSVSFSRFFIHIRHEVGVRLFCQIVRKFIPEKKGVTFAIVDCTIAPINYLLTYIESHP